MKIAYLAGANSIHSVRWIKFFADRGHDVVWISLAPPIPEAESLLRRTSDVPNIDVNVRTSDVPKLPLRFYEITPSPLTDVNGLFALRYLPKAVRQIKEILRKENPDILHTHSAGTYGLAAALANFHPAVLTPWGSDILLAGFIKKLVLMFVINRADAYTCDGKNTFERLIGVGADREKIHLIRFGTDVEKFKPENRKQKLENRIRIISLRSLVPIYDVETLIKAAAIVVKSVPNIEFIIAGDGDQRKYLENLAQTLNLMSHGLIRFVGRVDNEELPELLRQANIYVSTALSDSGLSASTAEAMATGLPVVVTDTGDNKDWVDNEFVIPVKSPEKLAEKIIALIKNEDSRKKQGVRNRQIIEEKNNYYIEMEKVERLYEKIIKSS